MDKNLTRKDFDSFRNQTNSLACSQGERIPSASSFNLMLSHQESVTRRKRCGGQACMGSDLRKQKSRCRRSIEMERRARASSTDKQYREAPRLVLSAVILSCLLGETKAFAPAQNGPLPRTLPSNDCRHHRRFRSQSPGRGKYRESAHLSVFPDLIPDLIHSYHHSDIPATMAAITSTLSTITIPDGVPDVLTIPSPKESVILAPIKEVIEESHEWRELFS